MAADVPSGEDFSDSYFGHAVMNFALCNYFGPCLELHSWHERMLLFVAAGASTGDPDLECSINLAMGSS